jgi:hypothetical protein
MANEREKAPDDTQESGQPQPTSQDNPKRERDEPGNEAQSGAGSEPPRSMGTRGTEFGQFGDSSGSGQQGQSGTGQSDLGSQAGSTLSGRADQQELGEIGGEVDQPGSTGGAQGEGFILQPERGTLEGEEEDVEGGQSRSGNPDIEQQ